MYRAIIWANKASNYKKHLDRVLRLGLHVCCSTPTAGLEAVLDVILFDLYAQCMAAQVAFRVQGRNQSRWDGIGHSHLWDHLFWSNKLLEQLDPDNDHSNRKRKIKDLFHNRWKEHLKHLTICCQTKYWIDIFSSIGNAAVHLDCPTLSIVLQVITGHHYLNYHHHIVGHLSEQICRFCGKECEELLHLACKCPALALECVSFVRGLQLSKHPPDLYGHARLT